jgi:hypothetical protein
MDQAVGWELREPRRGSRYAKNIPLDYPTSSDNFSNKQE